MIHKLELFGHAIEISNASLKTNGTVYRQLSMAQLEPAIRFDGRELYFSGLNPQRLLNKLTKKVNEEML